VSEVASADIPEVDNTTFDDPRALMYVRIEDFTCMKVGQEEIEFSTM
jgi:hypothetical protein